MGRSSHAELFEEYTTNDNTDRYKHLKQAENLTSPIFNLIPRLLHGFSQIMLQKSAVTGLFFVIGIGINSLTMMLGGIIATLSGLIIAKLCRYDSELIGNGIYGYNAALVGIALFYFLPLSQLSLVLLVFASALSTIIMHYLLRLIPVNSVFTTPFIISTWLVLLLIDMAGINTSVAPFSTQASSDFYSLTRGLGQVMFQGYWLSGVIFIIGLLFHSYQAAIWAVIGSGLGMLTARVGSFSESNVLMGAYGFNASLVALALTARYPNTPIPAVLGVMLSVLLTRAFEVVSLPALTAPFVLTTWLIIGMMGIKNRLSEYRSL